MHVDLVCLGSFPGNPSMARLIPEDGQGIKSQVEMNKITGKKHIKFYNSFVHQNSITGIKVKS